MGDLSRNFDRSEFRCKHCLTLVGPSPRLIDALQLLRDRVGRPLHVVSGYRCRTHNRRVGGSWRSQHVRGRAVDLPPGYATIGQAVASGFVGIGIRSGHIVHLDVRPGLAPFTFPD